MVEMRRNLLVPTNCTKKMGIATKDITRWSSAMKHPTMVEEHLWLLDCSYANKHSHDLDYPPLGALEMMIIYKINFNFYSVRPENSNWVHAVITKNVSFCNRRSRPLLALQNNAGFRRFINVDSNIQNVIQLSKSYLNDYPHYRWESEKKKETWVSYNFSQQKPPQPVLCYVL